MANGYKYNEEEILQLLPLSRTEKNYTEDMETMSVIAGGQGHSEERTSALKPAGAKKTGPTSTSPGNRDQTADLVRIYLKDMGSYLLLSREEEIALAKRIEQGEKAINKALARTPFILDELVSLEMQIRKSPELVNKHFSLGEEELTPESIEQKKAAILDAMKRIKTLNTRLAKMLEECQSVLCGLVERSAMTAETRVVMVPGNHDRATTLAMQLVLAAHFRNTKGVSVDTSALHRKYIEWGGCLIGLTHGDTARKRLPNLMQVERKEAWGRSVCREWHHGHFHREAQTVTEGGVTIREHLSLSPPDSWHAIEGYVGAPRGMDSYLYSQTRGIRGMWRATVLDG